MTRSDILALAPGPALDDAVAEQYGFPLPRVTREMAVDACAPEMEGMPCAGYYPFSTDWAPAGQLLDLARRHYRDKFSDILRAVMAEIFGLDVDQLRWPDVIYTMKPEHITKAALVAAMEEGIPPRFWQQTNPWRSVGEDEF